MIVLHYTAIPTPLSGRADIEQSGKANVGVQFPVDRDGTIYLIAPDNYFSRYCTGACG